MRVILDANIYISYLLTHTRRGIIVRLVDACLVADEIELYAPHELLNAITHAVARKPYLQQHIPPAQQQRLLAMLQSVAVIPITLPEILTFSRDPRDDYLIAYGIVEKIDYLVTGDDDLLSLKQVDTLQILSANEFLALLKT